MILLLPLAIFLHGAPKAGPGPSHTPGLSCAWTYHGLWSLLGRSDIFPQVYLKPWANPYSAKLLVFKALQQLEKQAIINQPILQQKGVIDLAPDASSK